MLRQGSDVEIRIGDWTARPLENRLTRGNDEVHLEPMVMDLLLFLADRPGQVVSKQEITDAVWQGRLIADATLSKAMSELRRTLSDDASAPRYVKTIPKRGYCLIATVETSERGMADSGSVVPPPPWDLSESPSEAMDLPCLAREEELAQLDGVLCRALKGDGQAVFTVGDAGAGKTYLVREFVRRSLQGHGDVVAAVGRCNWYNGLGDPFLPFREILRQLTGDVRSQMASGAAGRDYARRLWELLPVTGQALARLGPDLVGSLLSADDLAGLVEAQGIGFPEWFVTLDRHAREREMVAAGSMPLQTALLDQVGRVLQEVARHHPLVLVLEDLQWADHASLDLLLHLGLRLDGHRILIVGTYRPTDVALGRDGERHPLIPVVNELTAALGEVQVRVGDGKDPRFVHEFLDHEPNRLGPAFRDKVLTQTAGHALFTVELLEAMRARGMVVPDQDGSWVEGAELDWATLPARVRGVIAERVGRLPDAHCELLKVASVEGELFTAEAVARVLDQDPAGVVEILSGELELKHRLVETVAVHQTAASRVSTYRFRHLQFQIYLYSRVGRAERPYLHEAVGSALEELHGERAVDISPQLARHFQEAGDASRAIAFLRQAGERAGGLSAYREASDHFARALTLLASLPEGADSDATELELRLAYGRALCGYQGFFATGVHEQYLAVRDLCHRVGDPQQLVQALLHLSSFHSGRGENRIAVGLHDEALAIAERCAAPLLVAVAKNWRLVALFLMGEFERARRDAEEVVEAYDSVEELPRILTWPIDLRVAVRAWLSCIPWFLGYPDQAVEWAKRARDLAGRLGGGPFETLFVEFCSASSQRLLQDLPATRRNIETALAVSNLQAAPEAALAHLFLGWLEAQEGRPEQGIAIIRQYLDAQQAVGIHTWRTKAYSMLAEVCLLAGRPDEGLEAARAGLAEAEATEERYYQAELLRLEGELLLCLGEDDAEQESTARFSSALELARAQQARGWELRVAMSLARLWRGQGRSEQARELLGQVYATFTEGLATADLVVAKRLLSELGQE